MSTLYITEQGSKLRKTSKRLLVEKSGVTLLDVPAHEIDQVLVFGAVQLSTQAISFLLDSGIDVCFLSINGRLKGKLTPVNSKNVFLRLAQYDRYRDEEYRLTTARSFVETKVKNQRTLLLRYQRNHPDVDFTSGIDTISNTLSLLPNENTIPSLMGMEGISTRAYFDCYSEMLSDFTFEKRTRHPPLDPVNALLSLGYVLITNEMSSLLESSGFDPFIGFLHGLRYGRRSLPLDMIEEYRHSVIDGLVLNLLNKESIRESDFHRESNGAVFLNTEALKRFFGFYEERMNRSFKRNDSYTTSRKVFREQVDSMKRAVLNREIYQTFLVR